MQRDKGFGFVRYNTHEEAAMAIQMANGRIIRGKPMKVTKPLLQIRFILIAFLALEFDAHVHDHILVLLVGCHIYLICFYTGPTR